MTVAFVMSIGILLGLLFVLYNTIRRSSGSRLRILFAVIALFLAGLVFWGFLVEPGRLVVREQTIQIDNWPQQLDGLRIAVLSDIHADDWFVDDKKLRTIAQQQNVAFVSPIDLLCNAEGCLISTSKEILRPLAWDNSHLTEDGSNLLIELAVQNHRLNLPHPPP